MKHNLKRVFLVQCYFCTTLHNFAPLKIIIIIIFCYYVLLFLLGELLKTENKFPVYLANKSSSNSYSDLILIFILQSLLHCMSRTRPWNCRGEALDMRLKDVLPLTSCVPSLIVYTKLRLIVLLLASYPYKGGAAQDIRSSSWYGKHSEKTF